MSLLFTSIFVFVWVLNPFENDQNLWQPTHGFDCHQPFSIRNNKENIVFKTCEKIKVCFPWMRALENFKNDKI